MKIVLISLYLVENLSIRALHSILKNKGYNVRSIFLEDSYYHVLKRLSSKEMQILMRKIKEINPDIVGISVRSPYINIANSVTKSIKKEIGVPVIYGGVHATLMPEECLNYADMVCVGEGDEAFPELVNRLENKQRYNDIKGIWVKENGQIKDNGYAMSKVSENVTFNSFDDDSYYFIINNKISKNIEENRNLFSKILLFPFARRGYYNIIANKGCPFSCSFCINGIKKIEDGGKPRLKYRSVDNVIDEILTAKNKYHMPGVVFHDDIFTVNKNWIREFSDKYKKYINLPFMINSHFYYLDEEILKKLKFAGLKLIKIGIESGSKRINKLIYNRWFDRDKIIEVSKIIRDLEIIPLYDIIVSNPFEIGADKEATFRLLLDIYHPHLWKIILHRFVAFPRYKIADYINNSDIPVKVDNFDLFSWSRDYISSRFGTKENVFWNSLFWLISVNVLSKEKLIAISKSKFLKKNPVFLRTFCLLILIFKSPMFEYKIFSKF